MMNKDDKIKNFGNEKATVLGDRYNNFLIRTGKEEE